MKPSPSLPALSRKNKRKNKAALRQAQDDTFAVALSLSKREPNYANFRNEALAPCMNLNKKGSETAWRPLTPARYPVGTPAVGEREQNIPSPLAGASTGRQVRMRGILTQTLPLLLALAFYGCAFEGTHIQSASKLQQSSRVFNDAFENKRSEASQIFLPVEMRETFMEKFREIKKRVTFDEIEIVKIEYFKDGAPLKPSRLGPEGEFDKAEITMRYQVTVAPSNTLKAVTAKQTWIKESGGWTVLPDLDPFLN